MCQASAQNWKDRDLTVPVFKNSTFKEAAWYSDRKHGLWYQLAWSRTLALLLMSCRIWSKLPLWVSVFPSIKRG